MNALSLPRHWHHTHYDSVGSTMLCCRPETVAPGHILLVTADEQTAGRGQRGTTWESDRALNLTFNIGWQSPPLTTDSDDSASSVAATSWPAANEQFLISEVTALAVVRALQQQLPPALAATVSIKWPNDIYVGENKICGMLLEHSLSGRRIESTIAGIGINVNQPTFRSDAPNPISLRQLTGHDTSREAVLEAFAAHFSKGIEQLRSGAYTDIERAYTALLYRRTGFHPYRDARGPFRAELAAISRSGIITLRRPDGTLSSYAFKEVAFQ